MYILILNRRNNKTNRGTHKDHSVLHIFCGDLSEEILRKQSGSPGQADQRRFLHIFTLYFFLEITDRS